MNPKTRYKKYLCPPGNGVYTVHTGADKKEILNQYYFKSTSPEKIKELWEKQLDQLSSTDLPVLIGMCSDNGGGILRGANWGPLFLRLELLKNKHPLFFDIGDVRVIPHLLTDTLLNEKTIESCRFSLYGNAQTDLPVSPLSIAGDFCKNFHQNFPEKKLIMLGGDHSVSYPFVSEYIKAKRKVGIKVAIIHFDAHTDLLQQRLGIDVCFGSWAFHILKELEKPSHLIQLGIRSSGKNKEYWEKNLGIKQYWSNEMNAPNSPEILTKIIDDLKKDNIDEIYISFDIDALDESYASATGTPEAHGLSPYVAIEYIQKLCSHFKLTGADLVEVAPFINHHKNSNSDSTITVGAAIIKCFIENYGRS